MVGCILPLMATRFDCIPILCERNFYGQIMAKVFMAFLCLAGAELYCPDENSWIGIGGSTSWNGAENLATTWHTWFNHNGGCDQGGCGAGVGVGGQFHVKAEFGVDGWMHTSFNGNEIGGFNPYPSDAARNSVRDTMNRAGVTFSSSQWTGWVPGPGNVD